MHRLRYLLMALGLLLACEKRTIVRKDNPNPDFLASSDGTLYFKNVRQIAYYRSQPKNLNMTIYTHKELPQLKDKPQVWAYMAENWRFQEAYLMLESNEAFGDFVENRYAYSSRKDSSYHSFKAVRYHKPEFLRFADFVVSSFKEESPLYLIYPNGDSLKIFEQEAEKEAFRITLKDYKKWIAKSGD